MLLLKLLDKITLNLLQMYHSLTTIKLSAFDDLQGPKDGF